MPAPMAPAQPAPAAQPPVADTLALGDPCEGGEVTGRVGTGAVDGADSPGRFTARITDGEPQISGSLDKNVIRRVVKAHMKQVEFCYEKLLLTHPGLEGKLVAKWTIDQDGSVANASASGVHPDLETCMVARIKMWKFPKVGGGAITISYPFLFKKET